MTEKIALVFGGTWFLGRHVVRRLVKDGWHVKVVSRVPERAYKLRVSGDVGQIVAVTCDYNDPESVAGVIRGADAVVNCIGILYEKGKNRTFQAAHVEWPAMLAKICMEEGTPRLVHISALGCNAGISRYARSKLEGEKVVSSHYPKATIIRPSVIFGQDDAFFNMFAEMSRYVPFLPLIGGGKTRFQPVFAGDVAGAIVRAAAPSADQYQGKTYQLGGPDILDFREIYTLINRHTGRARRLVTVPYKIAKYGAWFMEFLPHPLLTRDQVNSLKTDSVVQEGAPDFGSFDIMPKSVMLIVPEYLERYREGGPVSKYRFSPQEIYG